ncbi:MAG: tRNA 2-thiouridine(34) synthase MnmA [Candidatus Liptonbacteria bacterium RIFCSPLOWO2_01_FULL_45_15]|uniref:tRNA-specific 2-thiouridylase MnmA n=1 Tax=Candidatus Liptonbacteria bacterium RIFCSPLOWO2_01_FULL_45_15 TaxID=1798649 RepID=A0A1G2CHL3_9BACT|nr:MAG: tRNA 2-thiouridine(34) synthase MnmA [Candidatus Liptonbacteria bacterium RIFCSPLOWO2_01_FULL_45_15]
MTKRKKVFVGMSGGVDSSVTAFLLKKKYDVVGVFMSCWTSSNECEAETDAEDARRVAGKLGIPFYVWDFKEEYKKKVVDYMVEGYRLGLTPNPDVMCNREIKFGLFLEKALSMGADYVATGQYVRLARVKSSSSYKVIKGNDNYSKKLYKPYELYKLLTAADKNKDQSYFLWTLTQKQLKHCLFPIGDYQKSDVRKIAKKAGLPTAEKKDSQGICFIGKVTLADFLKDYIPSKKGEVLNIAGEVIGKHSGAQFYTIGQRHIGMANRRPTQTERGLTQKTNFKPLYVAEKDIRSNTLVVAEGSDNQALFKNEVELTDVNFINPNYSLIRANKGIKVFTRVRYRQPLFRATLIIADNTQISADKNHKNPRASALKSASIRVVFDKHQGFVAPGQSAVFYTKAREMLGGGIIV